MNKYQKETYLRNFGKNVKKYREKLGMSQDELAIKCGYNSRSSINKIELGKSDIPYSKIFLIASALKIREIDLISSNEKTVDKNILNEEELLEQIQKLYGKDTIKLLEIFLSLNDKDKKTILKLAVALKDNQD